MLNFSQKKTVSLSCPLAFAENDVKTRVKSILSYKKPALYVIIISAVLCVVTMVLFMSSPVSAEKVEAPTDNTPQVQETVATASEETQPATEKETQAPTEKETEKPTEKPTEAVQEYYDNSYDTQNTVEYEAIPPRYSMIEPPWYGEPEYKTKPTTPPTVVAPSDITVYEEEIVWDLNSPSSSGVQRADGWITGIN